MNRVNIFYTSYANKAKGTDRVTGNVLTTCAPQTCYIYSYIINLSFPTFGSTNKQPLALERRKYVALTPVVMKFIKRIVLKHSNKTNVPSPCLPSICLSNKTWRKELFYSFLKLNYILTWIRLTLTPGCPSEIFLFALNTNPIFSLKNYILPMLVRT